jgi:uncharacterized protein YaeQ
MDRHVYAEIPLTLALHPSETEERLAIRVLAHALHHPGEDGHGPLLAAKGLSDSDEPDLWQKDLTEQILQWIEVGLPDDRRMARACSRAERVAIYAYAASTPVWFAGLRTKITRLNNLSIRQIDAATSQALAGMVKRAMQWQVTVQDGQVWVSDDQGTVEVLPQPLWPHTA